MSWSDMPVEARELPLVGEAYSKAAGAALQVRHAPGGPWYVTAGNLWGSQTVRAQDAEGALRLVLSLFREHPTPRTVAHIPGAELLDNPAQGVTVGKSQLP